MPVTESGVFITPSDPQVAATSFDRPVHYETIPVHGRSVTVRAPIATPVSAERIAELRERARRK